MLESEYRKLLFPFPTVRKIQGDFLLKSNDIIENSQILIAHAPTGIGKTAAVIAPALKNALESDNFVLFVTPKHTQHYIVIETLKRIKSKYKVNFGVSDFIGKKWMCLLPGVDRLSSRDFNELCKDLKRDERCNFFNKVRKGDKLSREASSLLKKLRKGIFHVEEICKFCKEKELCPYEICCELGKEAKVIIADYYHVFEPNVRKAFFIKNKKELENCILIVDEAHALPSRVRKILSMNISNLSLRRAVKEAERFGFVKVSRDIGKILDFFLELVKDKLRDKEEVFVEREEFIKGIEERCEESLQDLIDMFNLIGDEVREVKRRSYVGKLGNFLESWYNQIEGFAKILRRRVSPMLGEFFLLSNKCLDPSLATKEVFERVKSSILMSGTLTPTRMYAKLLGIEERVEFVEYPSPFPKENRLVLIVPETTTKFKRRGEIEYRRIARKCWEIVREIPGNVAIFFPSYEVKDGILQFFSRLCDREILVEKKGMSKVERMELYHRFKELASKGAVLFGVAGASFAEGIDLSGRNLLSVIVVGVPLEKPNLEVQALIDYYEEKFGAGWNFGYIFPAMIKVVQAAGRLIRSERDFGAVILLDERFVWRNYYKCLPKDWKIQVTKNPEKLVKKFFERKLKELEE